MGTLSLTKSSNCAGHDPLSLDSQCDLQAVESLQELSNVSLDQVFSSSSLRRGPFSIRIPKNVLSSSASQTLSPRTPTQAHSSDSKQCVNCQCTSTPLWRKDKSSGLMYCNACGIYFKNHGKHRPLELIEGPPQIKLQQPGISAEGLPGPEYVNQGATCMQAGGEVDMDWEEQRSELIDGLLSASSPCQLAMQEAVGVLLYMAQDDHSASGSGADSPQACDGDNTEGVPATGRKLRRRARKAVTSVRTKYMKKPGAANKQGTACNNCHTTYTPLWRKDCNTGEILCNACGIYLKTHGKPRALEGMAANIVRAGHDEPQARASPTSSRASSDTEGPRHAPPRSYRHQSAQTQTYTHRDMPDGAVHHVRTAPQAVLSSHASSTTKPQKRNNIKSSPTGSHHAQQASAGPQGRPALQQHRQHRQQEQQPVSPKLFKDPTRKVFSEGLPESGSQAQVNCSGSPADLACHEPGSPLSSNDQMTGVQAMAGYMQGGVPFGVTPQAAAALQFWLSQGALNPHVHASYLHSLQGPYGEPLGHHFAGLAAAFAAQHTTPQ